MSAHTMRPFRALMSREDALAALLAAVTPVAETEPVAVEDAVGRVAAEDVTATVDVPAFTRSAMDGYAVRAADSWGASRLSPKTLRVTGSLHAGETTDTPVEPGEAVQVATGGKLPPGADAVIKVEDTDRPDEAQVIIKASVAPGHHVSKQGGDVAVGAVVVAAGDVLEPAKLGVIASVGVDRVTVWRRARVAVVPTGNEVVDLGRPLKDGEVFNSNAYALTALLRERGADVTRFPVVPDTLEALEETLGKDAADHDLVVLTGGSSVGERDLVVDVLKRLGDVLVHGVQVKPGKPLLVARVTNGHPRVVMGLPGYPTSCLTNAYVFVLPALRRTARLPDAEPRTLNATLGETLASNLGRYQIVPVRLDGGRAYSTFKESGALTSLAASVGYIAVPDNVDYVAEGDDVVVYFW